MTNKIITILFLLIPTLCHAGNLVFMDRFNDDLSNWTLVATGGSVEISSAKMVLTDSSGSNLVSATRSFYEPSQQYLIEFDMKITSDGQVLKAQLLSFADAIIAEVDLGSTNDTGSFDTDNATASTVSWGNNVYKQVVLVVDVANDDITCYVSEDDNTYGSFQIVGTAKSYSGTAISKIAFTTTSAAQATAYVDEVRVYIPHVAIIGDSISDGKTLWSTHPMYSRTNETSPPSYHLSYDIDATGGEWVGNRGFGGSNLDGGSYSVDDKIQSVVIDQGFTKVIISAGHNDISFGPDNLTTLQTDINSIITRLQNGGITGRNICLCTVAPSGYIDTSGERDVLDSYNSWVASRAAELGASVADNYTALKNPSSPYVLNSSYNGGDGTHLNSTGSGVMAQTIYDAMLWTGTITIGSGGTLSLGSGGTVTLQ